MISLVYFWNLVYLKKTTLATLAEEQSLPFVYIWYLNLIHTSVQSSNLFFSSDLFKFDHLSTCCFLAAILTSGTQAMPYHSSTFAGSEIRYWHNVGNQLIYDHNLRKNMWRCETLWQIASGWFIEFLWAGASPLSCFYCLSVNKNFSRWNFDLLGMYPPQTKFIKIQRRLTQN